MNGNTYVFLGIASIALAFIGLAAVQLIMRKWKKRYDAEWEQDK